MKFAEIKVKSISEMNQVLLQTKKEMMNLRFRKAAGEISDTSKFKQLRKTVARVKTLMNQNAKKEI